MALKIKISKADYEKLVKPVQSEYVEKDGEYFLDVEGGIKDEAALLRAKDHEKELRKASDKRVKELEGELATITDERDNMLRGSIPKADAEKLEKSWQEKLSKKEKELTAEISKRDSSLNTLLVENTATQLAGELATAPALLFPHIKGRLKAELADGKAVTRVLDKDGNVSALTLDDLKKEILANADYKPILRASSASGGGANGANRGGGAATGKTIARSEFDAMPPLERNKFISEKGVVQDPV